MLLSNQSASSKHQFNSEKLSTKINQMDSSKISIRWTITSSLIKRKRLKINYQPLGICRHKKLFRRASQKNSKSKNSNFQGIVVDKWKRAKIDDGSWTENDLFQPFLICFADLKKYHYYYWEWSKYCNLYILNFWIVRSIYKLFSRFSSESVN